MGASKRVMSNGRRRTGAGMLRLAAGQGPPHVPQTLQGGWAGRQAGYPAAAHSYRHQAWGRGAAVAPWFHSAAAGGLPERRSAGRPCRQGGEQEGLVPWTPCFLGLLPCCWPYKDACQIQYELQNWQAGMQHCPSHTRSRGHVFAAIGEGVHAGKQCPLDFQVAHSPPASLGSRKQHWGGARHEGSGHAGAAAGWGRDGQGRGGSGRGGA